MTEPAKLPVSQLYKILISLGIGTCTACVTVFTYCMKEAFGASDDPMSALALGSSVAQSLWTSIILFVWPDVAHFCMLVPRYIYTGIYA